MFKCEKCGDSIFRTTFWNSPKGVGYKVICAMCGNEIKKEEYYEVE